jgi:hypothetical protein
VVKFVQRAREKGGITVESGEIVSVFLRDVVRGFRHGGAAKAGWVICLQ